MVIDAVKDATPGTLYTYSALAEVLQEGTEQVFDVVRVQAVVRQTQRRLLRESQRTLTNVRGDGYRLARADEHLSIALARRRRSDVQLAYGLRVLRNVRFDEMDENARRAHQGTLMITEALYAQTVALERRQATVKDAIALLSKRVADLTAGAPG